jgi:hypothetical protein
MLQIAAKKGDSKMPTYLIKPTIYGFEISTDKVDGEIEAITEFSKCFTILQAAHHFEVITLNDNHADISSKIILASEIPSQ